MEKAARLTARSLKALGAVQIASGVAASLAIWLFGTADVRRIVENEIMMDGRAVQIAGLVCMFLVLTAGVVSVLRLRWGWILSFTVAAFVLVMALLLGPAAHPVTRWSFLGLMILSLINWAGAVVYYLHDLYT